MYSCFPCRRNSRLMSNQYRIYYSGLYRARCCRQLLNFAEYICMQNIWLLPALGSAFFASLTAILAKIGIAGVDSNVATALRTTVIILFAWGIVLAQGRIGTILEISGKTFLFLGLSGLATGCSWLCYFYALKIGPVARVATIDKLSLALTIVLSVIVLHEAAGPKVWAGAALMIAGAFIATR